MRIAFGAISRAQGSSRKGRLPSNEVTENRASTTKRALGRRHRRRPCSTLQLISAERNPKFVFGTRPAKSFRKRRSPHASSRPSASNNHQVESCSQLVLRRFAWPTLRLSAGTKCASYRRHSFGAWARELAARRRIMSVPGVGPVTSVRFAAAVDDITRFASAHAVESFLGLTPGENSSSERKPRTGITKAGPAAARGALVQAAWNLRRTRPLDPSVSGRRKSSSVAANSSLSSPQLGSSQASYSPFGATVLLTTRAAAREKPPISTHLLRSLRPGDEATTAVRGGERETHVPGASASADLRPRPTIAPRQRFAPLRRQSAISRFRQPLRHPRTLFNANLFARSSFVLD